MQTSKKYPIVLIPGIMGSRLFFDNSEYTLKTVVWDPVASTHGLLQLNERLEKSNKLYIRPCENQNIDVNGGGSSSVERDGREYGAQATYQAIVDGLCEAFSYKDPERYRPVYFFNYDWRFSNADSARSLRETIDRILEETDSDKVDIVCHSMGGLVASKYYADYHGDGKLNKLVSIGTPFEGAPKLLNSILNWDVVGEGINPFEKKTWLDMALGFLGALHTELKASFIGVAELLPTDNYVVHTNMRKEVYHFLSKTAEPMSLDAYSEVCTRIFSEENFENARAFHRTLWTPGTNHNAVLDYDKSYYLIGAGLDTICSVRFDHRRDDVDKRFYEDDLGIVFKGDGHVPFASASMHGQVLKLPDDRFCLLKESHNGLVQNEVCLAWIVEKLKAQSDDE